MNITMTKNNLNRKIEAFKRQFYEVAHFVGKYIYLCFEEKIVNFSSNFYFTIRLTLPVHKKFKVDKTIATSLSRKIIKAIYKTVIKENNRLLIE